MIRVVFDTNILYSAILKPVGLSARAFDLITAGQIIPCVSDALLDEYRDVLFRPELAAHARRAGHVLDVLQAMALHVTPTVTLKISSDDDDNRIYECAAEALADYIVTGNTRHFPRPYKATRILTSRQLVELLLGKQP